MQRPGNKDTTISVRLSGDEERVVRRFARRKRSTVSDVIRDAVATFVESEEEAKVSPYSHIEDLIGCVTDLPSDLSESTGARFAEIVQEKARSRR